MLKLDLFSDGLLFQCDRCHRIGELITEVMEDEGQFYCWNCLRTMNQTRPKTPEGRSQDYAFK